MNRRAAGVGIWVSLSALSAINAASAVVSTPTLPHLTQVRAMYLKDHHGKGPQSEADLLPYSNEFEKLLASCKIRSDDLKDATLFLAGEVRALGGEPVSSLTMLQAFTHRITWSARRNCWDTFFRAEKSMEARVASALIVNRPEVKALYVFDHRGANPHNDVDLLPYSNAFGKILASCWINSEETTNTMIELSEKAKELGGRNVSTLMMLKAVTRRIDWKGKKLCSDTFDLAESHMESGGP